MIKSMTGFGRAELNENGKKISIEIKSVNHRYLDLNIRMPRIFNSLETDIRNTLKKYMARGKVDVFISYEDRNNAALGLKYNKDVAAAYLDYFKEMEQDFDLKCDIPVSAAVLARFPEVITTEDIKEDEESLWALIENVIKEAGEKFEAARAKEGQALQDDLIEKLDQMLEDVKLVEERYPQILAEYESKIRLKIDELLDNMQIDEARIAQEMVIFADRLCTDEEVVRLKNHITTMKQVLLKGGEVGRRLDFMAQEMNRESNTILSKANDFRTSEVGIELKTTVEKIREQIQNIE